MEIIKKCAQSHKFSNLPYGQSCQDMPFWTERNVVIGAFPNIAPWTYDAEFLQDGVDVHVLNMMAKTIGFTYDENIIFVKRYTDIIRMV